MPYRNPRHRKPWRERPEAARPVRGWVFVSTSTARRLRKLAKQRGTSRHKLADELVSRALDALGA